MSRSDGATATAARSRRAGDVEVSYDPALRILTAILGAGEQADSDELVHGLHTFYDDTTLGRLMGLQALVPEALDDTWRLLIADHLGPTVGSWCLRHIDEEEHASRERRRIPHEEWQELRYLQWPALHEGVRARRDLAARAWPAKPVPWVGSFLARAQPVHLAEVATEELHFTIAVPASLATAAKIGRRVGVAVTSNRVRLTATVKWRSDGDALAARVLHPAPLTSHPVRFRRAGNGATAEIELRDKPHASTIGPLLVHLEAASAPTAIVLRTFRCRVRQPGGTVREYAGGRDPVPVGTAYSGAKIGRARDRVFWQTSGTPPIEVVVVREGQVLWARGFAKKSRRAQHVRISVVLRPEAVDALAPGGMTTSEAGTLEAQGATDRDGSFLLELAKVSKAPFRGELVERLELDIG